ncbi:MAG: leucyl aminopeptidase [Planctomycetes bacterium]|nr:leucyl aminopeptidase [Planctomycetota bacterium]
MAAPRGAPDVRVIASPLEDVTDRALVAFVFEGDEPLSARVRALDRRIGGKIADALRLGDFKGKPDTSTTIIPQTKDAPDRVLLVGLGTREKLTTDRVRVGAGRAASVLRDREAVRFSIDLPSEGAVSPAECAHAAVEGLLAGQYRFDRYKTGADDRKKPIERITLVVAKSAPLADVRAAAERGRIVGEAQCFVRDLQNEPGNAMTPSRLAAEAQRVSRSTGLRCRVYSEAEVRRMGMTAFLAVAQGSHEPPKLIVLEWNPPRAKTDVVALVGKGITFDSGGISIKPWKDMWDMKFDMSGGAAVIGTMVAAAQLKLPQRLVGIVPATENLPSGTALKPGDIIRAMSGTTIEIHSTDAEGRMILADALALAVKRKPAAIIDLATLTGSIVSAIGGHASGLFSNDEKLAESVRRAGDATGERLWPMPMWDEYQSLIKSDVADIKNVGGSYGGSIAAAMFLRRFVADVPWVHLDIAGTAYLDCSDGWRPKGGAGVGVRLLIRFLEDRLEKESSK